LFDEHRFLSLPLMTTCPMTTCPMTIGSIRPSHLRRAILARLNGPSSWGLYGPLVARLAPKQQTAWTGDTPLGRYKLTSHSFRPTNTWPVYGPFT